MPLVRPLALVLLLATPALAQRPPDRKPPVQKFDFDDDEVEAGVTLPQMEIIGSANKSRHASLIRLRTTFVPEMLKSADDH